MLTEYINAAMHKAHYEMLEDNSFYGEIPGLQGVYANAPILEECREQLQEVLEGWIVLGLQLGHRLPPVGGIELTTGQDAA
ncbi:MAG: type II toxin-antitoxin system HicB family antitoxin [Chloroflexia bacterium]|jgi:predicted RNase H-like HicB family nuclease